MQAKATAKYVRLSPTKARRVIDLVRGRPLEQALATLDFTTSMAGAAVKRALSSAAANAQNNHAMRKEELWVQACYVDGGPTMKRMRRGSMGRGAVIRKRTSHITVVLADREED